LYIHFSDCTSTCSQWLSISTSQRSGQCFSIESRLCNNSALQEFDKQEYQEVSIGTSLNFISMNETYCPGA